EAVDAELAHPVDRVVDELPLRARLPPVDVGQVWREEAVERPLAPAAAVGAAHAARAEPLGVRGEVLVLVVDLVVDQVEEHPDATAVRLLDERGERLVAAEARLDRLPSRGPVAVVARE